MRRIHIINRCDICGTEQLLSDASEDELDVKHIPAKLLGAGLSRTIVPQRYVAVIPLVDDDWIEWEGKDYCPDCALVHVAAPEYFDDTHKEAAL